MSRIFQTPPDLVVKFQPIDIVEVILCLALRSRAVYQREIKGCAALNIGRQLSTTKSDGMWKFSATRQGWSKGIGGCDDSMKLCLSSSGRKTRLAKGEPAQAGSKPCDGRGNEAGEA